MNKITRNTDEIKYGLSKVVNFSVNHVEIIGEGFRSIAVQVNNELIFLIGKVPKASKTFLKEHRILPRIHNKVTYKIPNPHWFSGSTHDLPYGFLGYKKIEGVVLTEPLIKKTNLKNLAQDMSNFLLSLHSLDTSKIVLKQPDFWEEDKKLRDDVLPKLKQILTSQEYSLIFEWWERYLGEDGNFNFKPKFIHGDIWYENFILDKNLKHLVGIIDFESCGLGDPARDFAPLSYIGSDFLEATYSNYSIKTNICQRDFQRRISLQWQKREFSGIQYSIENNDEEELHCSIEKIRNGPIINC